jgi:hypothetical protein
MKIKHYNPSKYQELPPQQHTVTFQMTGIFSNSSEKNSISHFTKSVPEGMSI